MVRPCQEKVDEEDFELIERLRNLDELLDVSRKRKCPIIE